MPISLADLEAKFNVNLDPLKAGLYQASQSLTQFAQQQTTAKDQLSAFQQAANVAGGTLGVFKERMADARISMEQLGGAVASAGRVLTAGLTVPLAGLGVAAFKGANDIRSALIEIERQTGATGSRMQEFGQQLRAIGAATPSSFKDIGTALADLSRRTGATGADLTNLTKQELLLARLTGTDVSEAVRKSAQVFNQWGVSVKQQGAALDAFYRLHQLTGVTVNQLTDALARNGAVLRSYGFSLDQAAALSANLEKEGVRGERMFTSLRMALSTLAKAGITDAKDALTLIIQKIEAAKTPTDALQFALSLVGKRGAVDLVAGVREGVFNIDQLTQKAEQARGALVNSAAGTDTYAQAFSRLRNEVSLALEPLGKTFLGILDRLPGQIQPVVDRVKLMGDGFAALPKGAQLAVVGLGGFLASLGPVLFGLGTFIRSWPQVVAGFEAIRAVVTGLGASFGIFGGLFAVTLGLLAAFVAAFVLNVNGLRDDLVKGFQSIWDSVLPGAQAFFSGFQELGSSSLAQVAADWQAGLAKIGEFFQAGIARLKGQTPLPPGSLSDSGGGGDITEGQAKPAPTVHPAEKAANANEHLIAALNKLATAHQKLSPLQREDTRFTTELASAEERLAVLRAGESNIAGQVAARFKDVGAARREELVTVLEQTKALEKSRAGLEAYQKTLAETNQKIRELQGGQKAGALVGESFGPAVSGSMLKTLEGQRTELKALEQEQTRTQGISESLTKALAVQEERHASLTGATKAAASAQELLQRAYTTNNVLIVAQAEHLVNLAAANDRLEAAQKGAEAEGKALSASFKGMFEGLEKVAEAQRKANEAIDLQLYKEEEDAWSHAVTLLDQQQKRHLELTGTSKGLSEIQLALNEAWASGNDELALFLASIGDAVKADDQLAASLKQNRAEQSQFQTALRKTASFFQNEFTKGFEGFFKTGLKNFFPQLLTDLDSLLQQMAAKIVAADLTSLLFGSVTGPQAGGGATPASSSGGGLLGGLIGAVTSIFGGGGGTADAGVGGLGIGPSTLTSADLAGLAGAQSGGYLLANQPRLVGESGPEAFIPSQSGYLIPNHAMTQSVASGATRRGGGSTTVHFHINTPDVSGFKKSQPQLMADAHRMGEARRIRDGG